MSPEQDKTPGFAVDFGDDILAEAVAAVEARERKPAAATGTDDLAGDIEIAEEEPGTELAEGEILLETDLPSDSPARDTAEPDDGPGEEELSLAEAAEFLADEVERLQSELDAQAPELEKWRKRARNEARERRRLQGSVLRLEERAVRSATSERDAEEARAAAETRSRQLEAALRASERHTEALRERTRKEQLESKRFGHTKAVLELLPVIDNLEMATAHIGSEPSMVADGVTMILDQFTNALHRMGVQRMDTESGVVFNPELHEAVAHEPASEATPGTILSCQRPGYHLYERLLRPARVTVAGPAEDDRPNPDALAPAQPAEDPPVQAGEEE